MAPGYQYGMPIDQGERGYFDNRGNEQRTPREDEARGEAPATIVVRLPADAQLTVDGSPTRSTEAVRTLISPPLQPGKAYQYTLRAEVTRDGKKVERKRDVTVRAGQESVVSFDMSAEPGSSGQ
jgi:uncharacterized protein (TIGR03000 family)